MTKEQVKRGNSILNEIDFYEEEIKKISYTQHTTVLERKMYLRWNGSESDSVIPESLFRIVGKLVLSEYRQQLIKLKEELENL
jgi:hypothetical protein